MKRRTVVTAIVILVVGWLINSSLFTVDETEVSVVTRFGKPLDALRHPGLHVKLPWPIDKAIRVDRRQIVLKGTPQEMLTDDEKNVVIEAYLTWKVIDPKLFVATVQTIDSATARLRDLYTARLGSRVGNLALEDFINVGMDKVSFHLLAERIRDEVHETSAEHFGVEILSFQISGFTLPVENRASVVARMNADRARIAARYRSEGAEEALKIEAKAAARHETILASAHALSTRILGEADAEALRILGDAYSKDPEFYTFVRSLESYESIVGKNTTLFLDADSKLFKVLNGE